MTRYYRTKSGVITTWYNSLGILQRLDEKTGEIQEELAIDPEDKDATFCINGETIRVEDFIFDPIDKMIERVEEAVAKKDRWLVSEEALLATFLKETDKIGVVMDVETFDTVIPGLGFGIKSGKDRVPMLMVPAEQKYKKNNWHYKIEFTPAKEENQPFVGYEAFYFCDFCSMLTSGRARLVNLEKVGKDYEPAPVDLKMTVLDI